MMLTDTKLRSLVAGGKPFKMSNGEGLHVPVNPNPSVPLAGWTRWRVGPAD
jgi:hypothetical protein